MGSQTNVGPRSPQSLFFAIRLRPKIEIGMRKDVLPLDRQGHEACHWLGAPSAAQLCNTKVIVGRSGAAMVTRLFGPRTPYY